MSLEYGILDRFKGTMQTSIQVDSKLTDDGYIIYAKDLQRSERIGHITGELKDNTLIIDNLQVAPLARGKGIGSRLLQEAIRLGRQQGARYLRGEMKTEYRLHPDETREFYHKNGITVDKDGRLFMELSSSFRE